MMRERTTPSLAFDSASPGEFSGEQVIQDIRAVNLEATKKAEEQFLGMRREHPSFTDSFWFKTLDAFRALNTVVPEDAKNNDERRCRNILVTLIADALERYRKRDAILEKLIKQTPLSTDSTPGADRASRTREYYLILSVHRNKDVSLEKLEEDLQLLHDQKDISDARRTEIFRKIELIRDFLTKDTDSQGNVAITLSSPMTHPGRKRSSSALGRIAGEGGEDRQTPPTVHVEGPSGGRNALPVPDVNHEFSKVLAMLDAEHSRRPDVIAERAVFYNELAEARTTPDFNTPQSQQGNADEGFAPNGKSTPARPTIIPPISDSTKEPQRGFLERLATGPGRWIRQVLFGGVLAAGVAANVGDTKSPEVTHMHQEGVDPDRDQNSAGRAPVREEKNQLQENRQIVTIERGDTVWGMVTNMLHERGVKATSERVSYFTHAVLEANRDRVTSPEKIPIGTILDVTAAVRAMDEISGGPLVAVPQNEDASRYRDSSIIYEMQKGDSLVKVVHQLLRNHGLNWTSERVNVLTQIAMNDSAETLRALVNSGKMTAMKDTAIPVGTAINITRVERIIGEMAAEKAAGKKGKTVKQIAEQQGIPYPIIMKFPNK